MNYQLNRINLIIQGSEYHLIAFNRSDIEVVRFQEDRFLLPADGVWEKVQSVVNGNVVNGYLDVSNLKPTKDIILSKSEDGIENSRKINGLVIQNLLRPSEEKMFLSSLMNLGINYEEYQTNIRSISNKFFKGESNLDKLKDFYIRFNAT